MITPIIQLKEVNKTFNKHKPNQLHVLKNIDLALPNKGFVMLLGPSGSGKTTLLNVLGGLDKFDKGTIDIKNNHMKSYHATQWDYIRNYHIGYIFQNYHLLPDLTVYDNVAYVLRLMGIQDESLIEARVHYVLKSVSMFKYRKKNALQLSGGQQQRVAIARAIVKNPDIIIADEPTGNLDASNTLEVMTMLKEISKEKLVLMVTHEKDLANYYADRIILIEDGNIKDDQIQTTTGELELKYDETIYLKDLDKKTYQQDNLLVEMYQDNTSLDVKAKLIIKNDTVFIQIDPSIKKVKMLDARSTIKIKDEHQKDAVEAKKLSQNFDYNELALPEIDKKQPFMFSIKKAFLMALEKVFATTRRGKIMLFSFLLSGIVVAYAASSLAAVLFISPDSNMPLPKGYVQVSYYGEINEQNDITTPTTYDSLQSLLSGDGFINTLGTGSFYFLQPNGLIYNRSLSANLDIIDHVDPNSIVYGKMPSNDYEIVINQPTADQLIDTAFGQDIGIWTYAHILEETLIVNNVEIKISGITSSEVRAIYVSRRLANFIQPASIGELVIASSALKEDTVLWGVNPIDSQVLINKTFATLLQINANTVFPISKTYRNVEFIISGVYDNLTGPLYATDTYIEHIRFLQSNEFFVYDKEPILSEISTLYSNQDVIIYDVYEQIKTAQNSNLRTIIFSTYSTAFIVLGIATLGFYFVIRSSLVKRQYEIAIMRAIGVYKRDIIRAFLVEIFVLSTMSTLIGYLIGSYGFSLLSESVLGDITLFKVNALSVILGLIVAYLINIVAGILPVLRLLVKTPAQILSQYDM